MACLKKLLSLLKKGLFFVFLLILFYSINPKQSFAISWNYSGLDNNIVRFVKVSPANNSNIYCNGTITSPVIKNDLFKSTDYGNSWISLISTSTGLPNNPEIRSIALHPSNENILYAAVFDKGIYKSIDGGKIWTSLNFLSPGGLGSKRIRTLTIDPNNPSIIYAGLGNNNCTNGGVYKSIDAGVTWVEKLTPSKCDILQIVVDPTDSNIVYAIGSDNFKSINKGEGWFKIPIIRVNDIALDPQDHNTIYGEQVTNPFGFYRSIDGGISWQRIGLIDKRIHNIVVDHDYPNTIYVSTRSPDFPGTGVWKSIDKGITWTQINDGLPTLETAGLAISYSNSKKLFLGTISHGLWNYNLGPTNPIVLLPGFGGSWSLGAITTGVPLTAWSRIPIVWPYHNLRYTLTSPEAGYTEGTDYFEFYYDWRQKLDTLADTLDNYINNTVLAGKPAGTKVNLLGHSMGGLVARSYANKFGTDKVEKIITVGSPHQGALGAYYPWEAGLVGDEPTFQTLGLQFLLQNQKRYYLTDKDIIHNVVPSIQDLLPIFDYLKRPNGSIVPLNTVVEKNPYLPTLNDSDTLKQKLTTIYGKETNPSKDTTEYYKVNDRNAVAKLLGIWPDGIPFAKEYTAEGDLTVLAKSAVLSGAASLLQASGSHVELVETSVGIQSILAALGLSSITPNTSHTSPLAAKSLVFLLHSPANIKITDSQGAVGWGEASPPANHYYDEENKLILIANPQGGNYQIQLTGTGSGTYHLNLGWLDEDSAEWQNLEGKISTGEVINFNLFFDPNSPFKDSLKDPTGETFLNLAKQRLDELDKYVAGQVSPASTKSRLQYSLKQNLKSVNQALTYFKKPNYLRASDYAFSSFSACFDIRVEINNYVRQGKIPQDSAIYLKNELAEISRLLGLSWVSLYKKAAKSVSSNKTNDYQQTLTGIFAKLEPLITLKASLGENKHLGLAYALAQESFNNAKDFKTKADQENSYINFVSSRFFLIEVASLLR